MFAFIFAAIANVMAIRKWGPRSGRAPERSRVGKWPADGPCRLSEIEPNVLGVTALLALKRALVDAFDYGVRHLATTVRAGWRRG